MRDGVVILRLVAREQAFADIRAEMHTFKIDSADCGMRSVKGFFQGWSMTGDVKHSTTVCDKFAVIITRGSTGVKYNNTRNFAGVFYAFNEESF